MPTPVLPTRVLCVDDSPDITEAMRLIIDTEPSLQCVGCLASADHLIEEVCRRSPRPDVVLLDATMPGRSPFAAMRELAAAAPEVKTIVYSGYDDPEFIERAIDAGAWGCVSKHEDPTALVHAISEVAAGRVVFPGGGESAAEPPSR